MTTISADNPPPAPLRRCDYLAGRQCRLRLWQDFNAPDRATDADESFLHIFNPIHHVSALARARHPHGQNITADRSSAEATAETDRILRTEVPALFGATFEHGGVMVTVDILERVDKSSWRIVMVKSGVHTKDYHVLDVALQLWAVRGAGLRVHDAGVLLLNGNYVYDGIQLDVDTMFRFHTLLEKAEAMLPGMDEDVLAMRRVLSSEKEPRIAPGDHCKTPFPCPYYGHCTHDIRQPEHGVSELPNLRSTSSVRQKLDKQGIEEIRDIPRTVPLTRLQRVVRTAVQTKSIQIHRDLTARLDAVKWPVRHLDFETFSPAVPRFAGTRPFARVPFLFSVHTEHPDGRISHSDHIHAHDSDPRPELTERLIAALGDEGTICVYSGFENSVLGDLARLSPQHAAALVSIQERLLDLLQVVKKTLYDPEFRGSFSIKRVFPALVSGLGYDDLEVSNGLMASAYYERAMENRDENSRHRDFEALRRYCERDTTAMVELRKALVALNEEHGD